MTDPIERMYDKAFAPATDACIIATGSIKDGFDFVGPFDDHDEALRYADSMGWEHGWNIVPLVPPEPAEIMDTIRDVNLHDHVCDRSERTAEYDGHGIFMTYTCPKCRKAKLSQFRRDIFTQYDADEPIEEI